MISTALGVSLGQDLQEDDFGDSTCGARVLMSIMMNWIIRIWIRTTWVISVIRKLSSRCLYDNQETDTDTSAPFERVVKHIMHRKGYTGQVVARARPATLSCPGQKETPLPRFPPSLYVAQKLENMRHALKHAAVATTSTGNKVIQKYFKPPVFLSRVSEVGDPVKSSESTKMPAKQVSSTPDEWVDILSDLKVSDKRALGKAFLQPQETRSVELACKWGTKVLNYVDHFANHAQALQKETSSYMNVVKTYIESSAKNEDGTSSLPKEVETALSKMESKQGDFAYKKWPI